RALRNRVRTPRRRKPRRREGFPLRWAPPYPRLCVRRRRTAETPGPPGPVCLVPFAADSEASEPFARSLVFLAAELALVMALAELLELVLPLAGTGLGGVFPRHPAGRSGSTPNWRSRALIRRTHRSDHNRRSRARFG